ncbi:toprim domain-containing protein [Chryseobacterium manosquense]|uniref:Toprim domain-containing protein n=1 Tax=Chryseobacterium manosquense TaxID=2754694 RepID=A0A7H1DXM4_9FLAO|nr:toprim domain-containing protein [Chryseobacterium manosquense]QNS41732.1 toprim domain-containing protein [Chryseobacterium manosquense]
MNCKNIKEKVGIRSVLESFNHFPVKENKKTAFYFALDREEKIPSLSVDFKNNQAFDFGTGRSYDVISIVQLIKKCSVSDALKYLSQFVGIREKSSSKIPTIKLQNYRITKVQEVKHPALVDYLKSRKVFEQKDLVKEIHYEIGGKQGFGIGFENQSGGFEIRHAYSKICLGKKDITLIQSETKNSEIAIFEGFFDYLTFRNLEKNQSSTCDYLILNSTSMLFKAEEILKNYSQIFLFLDNDENGKSVKLKIQNQYRNVEDCSLIYHSFKDLNEWWCSNKR